MQTVALLMSGAVAFVFFGPAIDRLFPVVDPFVVAGRVTDGQDVRIHGWLYKRRDCEFVEAVGRVSRRSGPPIVVPFEFLDTKQVYTRPPGMQAWGPWRIVAPADATRVDVVTLHACHPLWRTRSELASIDLEHEQ